MTQCRSQEPIIFGKLPDSGPPIHHLQDGDAIRITGRDFESTVIRILCEKMKRRLSVVEKRGFYDKMST